MTTPQPERPRIRKLDHWLARNFHQTLLVVGHLRRVHASRTAYKLKCRALEAEKKAKRLGV